MKPGIFPHYSQLFITRLWRPVWLIFALSVVSGCQSFSYQTLLKKNVLHGQIQQSTPFKHRIFSREQDQAPDRPALHIYIEGDGRPWRARLFVANDPTPSHSLMLDAMLRDPAPSLYLGRPCYYHTEDPACSARDWTMARYSPEVVASMSAIVDDLGEGSPELWLIGHSGGGTLAVLIGRRLRRPVNVLTIAGNLDHQAWTDYHQYAPLTDSLNPIDETSHNPQMREMHWYGREDVNVPPRLILAYCRQQTVECRESNATHSSGWVPRWEEVLAEAGEYFSEESDARSGRRTRPRTQ